ncbi:MAG TPA: serine/threonine-protein kinase, partial [Polyangiaceae bacterium]
MNETKLLGGGTELAGEWKVEELIGRGGSAAVYRAHRSDGTPGAVKVMHPQLALNEHWVRRFAREVALLRKNPHPGVATVLDVGEVGGTPFYVMELLQGTSLEALRSSRGGFLPVDETLRHADAVLEVLAFVHEAGIVHRDIKPSNLFLTESGAIKVLDFGIASGALSGEHTTTGGILGTPAFMAPEHARGRLDLVDRRSDLWSLGASLFFLITGHPVHVAQTENERLGLAMARPARRLRHVSPQVPAAVAEVVDRALAYDPNERFQTALEFRDALRKAAIAPLEAEFADQTQSDSAEWPVPRAPVAERSKFPAVYGLALAALAVIAWLALASRPGATQPKPESASIPRAEETRTPPVVPATVLTVSSAVSVPPRTSTPSPPVAAVERRPLRKQAASARRTAVPSLA